MPQGWTPDQPHPDKRRELFAKSLANGAGPSAAFSAHMSKNGGKNANSVKASAYKIQREGPVSARVLWWRDQLNSRLEVDESTPITSTELRNLMEEVSAVLVDAHHTGEMSGVASEALLAKVRRAHVVHLGRLSRSTRPETRMAAHDVPPLNMYAVPLWCACD